MQIGQLLSGAVAHNPNLNKLTDKQRAQLDQILSKFDPATFNQDDFNALNEELKKAGIRPNAELKKAIEAHGINVEPFLKAGNAAVNGPKGALPPPPPPPPPPAKASSSDAEDTVAALLKAIADFLEKLQSGTATEDDTQQLAKLAQQAASQGESGLLVDQVA